MLDNVATVGGGRGLDANTGEFNYVLPVAVRVLCSGSGGGGVEGGNI